MMFAVVVVLQVVVETAMQAASHRFTRVGADGVRSTQKRGCISISDVEVKPHNRDGKPNRLPMVKATSRVGVDTDTSIPPTPFAEFACQDIVQRTQPQRRTRNPAWSEDLSFPFYYDEPSPGEEVNLSGAIACKVIHHGARNAVQPEVPLGSVTYSLAELGACVQLADKGEPVAHCHTLFRTSLVKGKSNLRSCGEISATIRIDLKCDVTLPSEAWAFENKLEHMHSQHANASLHSALHTANSITVLPRFKITPRDSDDDLTQYPVTDKVFAITLTVHALKNLPEDCFQPACQVYIEDNHGELSTAVVCVEPDSGNITIEKCASLNHGDMTSTLVVDIVERAATGSSVKFTYGRIRLPFQDAEYWLPRQWHHIQSDSGSSGAEDMAIEMSASLQPVLRRVATHVAIAVATPSTNVSKALPEKVVVDTPRSTGDEQIKSSAVPVGVRKFYDAVDLTKLDKLDAVLLEVKDFWQRAHKYDCTLEELEPVLTLALDGMLLDDIKSDVAEVKLAQQNVTEKASLWSGKRLKHWNFKEFCKFWREFVDDTVAYGQGIAQMFHDCYSKALMEAKWLELDADDSGELENDEIDQLLEWLFGVIYGDTLSEKDLDLEKQHFRGRLDTDKSGTLTFDEVHHFIVNNIRWLDEHKRIQERRVVAEMHRAVACIQASIRSFLTRKQVRCDCLSHNLIRWRRYYIHTNLLAD
jgi:hypothetical protein